MILVVVEEGGNNVHEICLLHFMRQEITCFSVEQCNKEGNEDNIVPPACQGPVNHFSQKATHLTIFRVISYQFFYKEEEVSGHDF